MGKLIDHVKKVKALVSESVFIYGNFVKSVLVRGTEVLLHVSMYLIHHQ